MRFLKTCSDYDAEKSGENQHWCWVESKLKLSDSGTTSAIVPMTFEELQNAINISDAGICEAINY